jgi:predicted dehydrogenase
MRAAIIGAGYIGRLHARLIGELGGQVVAVCGRALSSAQSFSLGNAYADVEAMLRAEKPDVVHVCSPNHTMFWRHSGAARMSCAKNRWQRALKTAGG